MSPESRITHLREAAGIPGLAYVHIDGGQIVAQVTSGSQSMPQGQPINQETVFEAASLSKPVFATLFMQLVAGEVFDLDKPLHHYLPYDDIAHDARYREITARMVLHHATGFPNWRGEAGLHLQFAPGSQFSYSGEGVVYLQKVVEHCLNQPLTVIAREQIFGPLGMPHSDFIWQPGFVSNLALPYDKEQTQLKKWQPPAANAAGSLHTCLADYGRFLQALLTNQGLKPPLIKQMFTPQIRVPGQNGRLAWGLGFGLEKRNDSWAMWHWGSNNGYKSFCWADAAQQAGFVLLTNSDQGLSIAPRLLQDSVGGSHPAFSWLQTEYNYQYL